MTKNQGARGRCLLLILLATSLMACSEWFADEHELMRKADEHLDQKNINAAVIDIKNVLQINPDNARARYLLAGINLDYGDFATAVKEFRQAEVAGWNSEEARLGVARALLGMDQLSELRDAMKPEESWTDTGKASLLALQAIAEAGLDKPDQAGVMVAQATALDPGALQVIRARAQLQMLAGELDAAREGLRAALEHYPDNQELLLLDAGINERAGDADAAAALYQRVIGIDPPGFISVYGRNACLQLTQLQIMAGKYPLAEATLRPLTRRDPDDPIVNYLAGVLAFEQGDYIRAEELLLKVLRLAPEHNPTRLLYGTVNFAVHNYEQAAYYLAKYLAAVPDNLAARKLLARSYILLGRAREARSLLGKAQPDATGDAELLALVGLSDLARGERNAGIASLEQALKLDSANLPIRTELARAYIEAGDSAQAISELKSVMAAGGEWQQTGMLLVLAHLRAGEFNQAIKQVLEMLHGHEQDPALQTLAGNVFAASGDHAEARRYLAQALQLKPDLPPAILTLANIEELEKNYEAATGLYERLVDMGLVSTVPMLALARVAEQQGDEEAMLDWLRRAVKHAPEDNGPRLLLAEYYLRSGSVMLAWPLVKTALEKAPTAPEVLVMQARLLMVEDKYADALNPLKTLQMQESGSLDALVLQGECYLELGQPLAAREQIAAALNIAPASLQAMSLLARLEIESGSNERALDLGRQIQKASPELYLGYELAGDALSARGNFEDAGREYQLARERQQQVSLVIKQAENARRSGNPDAAADYLRKWLSDHPDDVLAMQVLGTIWQDMGEADLAIQQYERILARDEDNPVALNNLAGLYQQAGRTEAPGLAERAVKAAPDDPGVLDTYAWIQVRQGDAQEGLRLLEQVVARLPDNPEVRYHHAVAVIKAGDPGQGRRLLEALVNEEQAFPDRDEAIRILKAGVH